jgi:predicted secreted protein
MSDGQHGHGVTLKTKVLTNTTAASNYTTIGNITTIGGPSQARDPIEISTMDSTTKFREFIPGMLDAGEITCDINYDGAASGTGNNLNTLYLSTATDLEWVITFADTSSYHCVGFITALGHAIPFDDKVTQSVSVKLSGVPTFTDVAP